MFIIYVMTVIREKDAYNLVKKPHDVDKKQLKHLHSNANSDTQMKEWELLWNVISDIIQ